MSGSQAPYAIALILWLVLVASALLSRRLPAGKLVKLALIWLAVFTAGFLLFEVVQL